MANNAFPACAVGIDLLRRLEAARPNDYAFLQAHDFVVLHTSTFVGIPEWNAFQMTNLTNTGYAEILGVRMPSRNIVGGFEFVLCRKGN